MSSLNAEPSVAGSQTRDRDVDHLRADGRIRLSIVMGSHWAVQMGGAQYQAKCLIESILRKPEFEIFYLSRTAPADFLPEGYQIVPFAQVSGGARTRFLADLIPLYRRLKSLRPSVVYQRGLKGYTGICAFYCQRSGARLIFHVAHDADVQRARFRGLSFSSLVRQLERWIAEYGLRRADAIVVQTADQGRMLWADYGLKARKVVPNFHPIPEKSSPRVRADDEQLRVIWVANFKPVKRPEVFVNLAETFAGDTRLEFVMIGRPGEPRHYRLLHERMNRLANLRYLGEQPIERVNEEIAESDIFVNTSTSEGFPNTFVQAWMRGVPVVSSFVDPDGCLSDGGAGILAGNDGSLASIIDRLVNDRSALHQISQKARAYGFENHSAKQGEFLVSLLAEEHSKSLVGR